MSKQLLSPAPVCLCVPQSVCPQLQSVCLQSVCPQLQSVCLQSVCLQLQSVCLQFVPCSGLLRSSFSSHSAHLSTGADVSVRVSVNEEVEAGGGHGLPQSPAAHPSTLQVGEDPLLLHLQHALVPLQRNVTAR